MNVEQKVPAIVVLSWHSLHATPPGGVQNCTREFIESLKLGGFELTIITYDTDRRVLTRLRRKLWKHPYTYKVAPTVVGEIVHAQRATGSQLVVLCGVELAEIAKQIRRQLQRPGVRLVLFSYALKSVDFLHNIRIDGKLNSGWAALTLGRLLLAETRQRQYLDYVLCLAPFEVTMEKWIGTKQVDWIPRTIPTEPPLSWQPNGNRFGCVCTLHHGPNVEGLLFFLRKFEAVAPQGVRFRLVGQPESEGQRIGKEFRSVDYLGHLDDQDLRGEACSWNCLVHPLFCYAAGASMKLATALAWQIPIVTTTIGQRGYIWREGQIPTADDPDNLVSLTLRMLDLEHASAARDAIRQVAASCVTLEDVAAALRRLLLGS